MLDQKTGRLSWGDGKALWPGMTHTDFEQSVLYKEELLNENYKIDPTNHICNLKTQIIDGYPMAIRLTFSHKNYLDGIIMSQPEFYDWPDWPATIRQEDYLLQIKNQNDRFLATQFQNQLEGERELEFMFDWGTISSTYSFVHNPDAQIFIYIATWKFDPTFVPDDRPLYEIMGWTDDEDNTINEPDSEDNAEENFDDSNET
jgi:hypothetical protein